MKTHFEIQVCSRCHGSGRYSYCSDYGDRCFRCAGSGKTLTKRGATAKAYLEAICSKPATALNVGDRVLATGITLGGKPFTYVATVVKVVPEGGGSWSSATTENGVTTSRSGIHTLVEVEHPKYGTKGIGCSPEQLFRVFGADNEEKIKQALEYQATLTKQGTVRKDAKRAA
jgi:hypothetical protein